MKKFLIIIFLSVCLILLRTVKNNTYQWQSDKKQLFFTAL